MIRMESTWKPFWTGIIAMMKKSIKQTNLEREKIMSQRETGETREYYGTFIPFTKLRSIQWIT
jgi:hypothetical protein